MDKAVIIAIGILIVVLVVFFAFQAGANSTTGALASTYQSSVASQVSGGGCGA